MMKRIVKRTFYALILSSLLLITVGTVMAAEPGYERFSRPTQVIPTIDGKWTSDDEWTDSEFTWMGTDVAFTSTWDMQGSEVYTRWIVEFLTDTTDDSEDFLRMYLDGDQSGGNQPMGCTYEEISGHTTHTIWLGAGGLWSLYVADLTQFDWANSLSTSPTEPTPHWIYEFQIIKNTGDLQLNEVWNFLLQVYDASNPGFHAWPPTDQDIPDQWGIENYTTEPIPEGLTFAVMALLTTISMLVGYKYLIKRKETKTQ